jgi:hypothetical protein
MPAVSELSSGIEPFRRRVRNARARERYGLRHRLVRREFAAEVARGGWPCARCGEPIAAGEAWDLDHDDLYPHLYLGPAHRRCNRAAANEGKTSREW